MPFLWVWGYVCNQDSLIKTIKSLFGSWKSVLKKDLGFSFSYHDVTMFIYDYYRPIMEADEHILTLRYTCNVVLFSFYSWSENSFYLWRFKHWWIDIWMLDCELFQSGSIKGRVPKVTKSGAIVLHIFPLILLWWKKTAFLVIRAIVPFCKNLCTSELCYFVCVWSDPAW